MSWKPRRPASRPPCRSATVETTTVDLGRSRQAAARSFGALQVQGAFDGAAQGRNREQETWRQHRARVTATAVPDHDDHDDAFHR